MMLLLSLGNGAKVIIKWFKMHTITTIPTSYSKDKTPKFKPHQKAYFTSKQDFKKDVKNISTRFFSPYTKRYPFERIERSPKNTTKHPRQDSNQQSQD